MMAGVTLSLVPVDTIIYRIKSLADLYAKQWCIDSNVDRRLLEQAPEKAEVFTDFCAAISKVCVPAYGKVSHGVEDTPVYHACHQFNTAFLGAQWKGSCKETMTTLWQATLRSLHHARADARLRPGRPQAI